MATRHLAWLLLALAACSGNEGDLTTGGPQSANGDGDGDQGGPSGGDGDGDQGGPSGGDGDGDDPTSRDPSQPLHIDDCGAGAGGLSDSQIAALKAGGAPGSARIVYPYDGTAFPRGLEGPQLMWDGVASTDAVYVHIKSMTFEYHGCLKPTGTNQLQLPQDVWEKAGTKTFGKKDPFKVELSLLSGGKVQGPLTQEWVIAQATIKGSIYYNSYISLSTLNPAGNVYRIPAGGKFEPFGSPLECNGCHSVSANGTRMTSQTLALGGRTYNIESGKAQEIARPATTPYTALYPDGSMYLQPSLAIDAARSLLTSITAPGAVDAALYATDTGQKLSSQGIPTTALMPSFSSDGKLLVFTDAAADAAHGLALVNFDAGSRTGSGYKVVFRDSEYRPGWPHVLPDNQGVVFVRDGGLDWSGAGIGVLGSIGSALAPYSELFMVDLDTGKHTLLARAMGYATASDAASGKTYLPFGKEETGKVYFPTISPVAAGGFFWVFFDALRHYGNLGMQRQLWGAAIEISPDGDYSVDRSYPAFYLPGQEFGTGNHRAFTALDPCKMDGDSCTSGVDCCGGFCNIPTGGEFGLEKGTCSSSANECSRADERCEWDSDCCEDENGDATYSCIAGFCTPIVIF